MSRRFRDLLLRRLELSAPSTELVELPGDHEWARFQVASAAGKHARDYIATLRKTKGNGRKK